MDVKDKNFDVLLKWNEKAVLEAFEVVVYKFLGKHKSPNYRTLVENMLKTFRNMGWNMSIKLHFLRSHLDVFTSKIGYVIDEHDECFYQDFSTVEKYCQGKWSQTMLIDYCWQLKRETQLHTRQKKV
jgi:hypothetical protein